MIANPKSGNGKGERVIPRLEQALKARRIDFLLHRTAAPGHARQLAQDALGGAAQILVVGGDGTIHEVADGLLNASAARGGGADLPPLAILPVGTGNDFFRMVHSSGGISQAVDALENGVPRWFEVGEARWDNVRRHFVNLIGVGVDAEVLRRRSAFSKLPGILQYLGALGIALLRYRPVPLKVTVRSQEEEPLVLDDPVLLSAVTVGPSVGGGFMLSPKATPDDGLLDLFHVGRLGALKVLRYLPGILRGAERDHPEISRLQGTHIHFQRMDDGALSLNLDGELVETLTPSVEIRVRSACLQILEPPESTR